MFNFKLSMQKLKIIYFELYLTTNFIYNFIWIDSDYAIIELLDCINSLLVLILSWFHWILRLHELCQVPLKQSTLWWMQFYKLIYSEILKAIQKLKPLVLLLIIDVNWSQIYRIFAHCYQSCFDHCIHYLFGIVSHLNHFTNKIFRLGFMCFPKECCIFSMQYSN